MKIAGLQRVSLIDYPDRIAATVFVAGCNLDCGFCHNRWMLDEGDVAEVMSPSALLEWLSTRTRQLDGVCITGGEPLLAPDLPDLVRAIKALGLAVKLDTNGCFPERLKALLDERLLDYVAMDIKAPLDERYAGTAGVPVDLERLQRSMDLIRKSGVPFEFRTTVHPGLDAAALLVIAGQLSSGDPWVLQPYVPSDGIAPGVRGRAFLPTDELEALLPALRAIVPATRLRAA